MRPEIPLKRLVDFIKSQPDNRKINMSNCTTYDKGCGCLLIQFGKEDLGYVGHFTAGFLSVGEVKISGLPALFIQNAIDRDIKTYGKAKALIVELNLDKPLDIGA